MTEPTLVERLLAKPTAPTVKAVNPDKAFTNRIEVAGDNVTTEVRGPVSTEADDETQAQAILRENGLDPLEYAVTGFRKSEWDMPSGEKGHSTRYTFARVAPVDVATQDISELLAAIEAHPPVDGALARATGDHTFIVALGDMQFFKIDGDGVEGTLRRTIENLDKAAETLAFYRQRFNIGHIHVAWLGDHIEGFVSQGGANVWRTQGTLSEQTRLVRRVMLHAMLLFAPLAERVTMVAVPGNHGETTRFAGKGVTRYDDSHDTEALIAVSEAAALDPERFGHVEFYVPETDDMTVTLDLSGTVTAHAHGHQFRPGKHFEWWGKQAFGGSPLAQARLLLLGHLHHELIEDQSGRKVIQVPALESESTWYRHAQGVTGNPGIIIAVTKDGSTDIVEVVR